MTLHCYRYAWAERAKQCGYPERFAQEALGHNSKAVHRAYSRKAKVKLPSLENYERQAAAGNVIPFQPAPSPTTEPLYTVSPFDHTERVARMFVTHPPLADRVARLRG